MTTIAGGCSPIDPESHERAPCPQGASLVRWSRRGLTWDYAAISARYFQVEEASRTTLPSLGAGERTAPATRGWCSLCRIESWRRWREMEVDVSAADLPARQAGAGAAGDGAAILPTEPGARPVCGWAVPSPVRPGGSRP